MEDFKYFKYSLNFVSEGMEMSTAFGPIPFQIEIKWKRRDLV